VDYKGALAYLDEHTNLEGGRSTRFLTPGSTTSPTPDLPALPPMPTAGQHAGLSLDPMLTLMDTLGRPHEAFRSIHITGTNGKGSTARFTAAALRNLGLSVGLYTSPNLSKVNERISWDGHDISDEDFARVVKLLADIEPFVDQTPSRFELLTAAAFVYFAEQAVDVAVVEVGLLGRFDATNVINSDVAVITNIGKDHTTGEPGWRREVASEKAGIIKPNSHVILGTAMGDLRPIFDAEESESVWEAGVDFWIESNELAVGGRVVDIRTPSTTYEELFIPFHGAHQGDNIATGLVALEAFFGRAVDQDVVETTLGELELPVRFEVVARNPTVILDGAHNPHGAEAVSATLTSGWARTGSWVLIVGVLQGKGAGEMLDAFDAAGFDAIICTEPDSSRAVPAEVIAEEAEALGLVVEVIRSPIEALRRATAVATEEDLILVSGSLYVVAEVREALMALQASEAPDYSTS
jgi:dihydrofolate synthase/folylpolyglutamate synthase